MKITHINTLSSGGAANAAIRLHQGLLNEGVDSRMLFLKSCPSGIDNTDAFIKRELTSLPARLKGKLLGKISVELKLNKEVANRKGYYETVSFPLSSYKVEGHPWIQDADIIHLHWISKFINYPSFFGKVEKPIVWTLHDMNPICGIFHYQNDVTSNEANFGSLERKYIEQKKGILSTVNSLSIVAPSLWLERLSSRSEILGRFDHQVIPYGLDMELFKPYDQQVARQVFNLPLDKKIFLFVCEGLKNKRKGFDLLLDAFEPLKDKEQMAICAVGRLDIVPEAKNTFFTGPIHDDRLMALLYSAADAFVLPSREDNLPNTMLEAMASGTPVISFSIGGMKETIISGMNGLMAENISAESLGKQLAQFLSMGERFDRQLIRKYAIERFSLDRQADAYIRLYKHIAVDQKINNNIP